jgi:AcrR family transcriptional regulator
MPPSQSSSPARRADAERNRDKILAAARAAFADPQADVSMAEISRRAGVGMATLYRNFPGRRELLEALFVDEVNALCEAAQGLEADTPGALLMAWLHEFFAFLNTKRHVGAELLKHSGHSAPFFSENRDRVLAAGRPLLAAAQRSREVRDDLTLDQILDMIVAIATIHGDPDYLEPILQTTLDGLRVPLRTGPGPHADGLGHAQRKLGVPVTWLARDRPGRPVRVPAALAFGAGRARPYGVRRPAQLPVTSVPDLPVIPLAVIGYVRNPETRGGAMRDPAADRRAGRHVQ